MRPPEQMQEDSKAQSKVMHPFGPNLSLQAIFTIIFKKIPKNYGELVGLMRNFFGSLERVIREQTVENSEAG